MAQDEFSGTWYFCYWYPSNDHEGDDPSEYIMTAHQDGNALVLESQPNDIEAYMLVRLTIDGDLATGTWHETTSPHGAFQGMQYNGAGQLLLSADRRHMEGQWAGAGYDHEQRKPRIYSGRWEISRSPLVTER